jgi:F0F1-type ATP synthase gamma subunit
MLFPAKHENLQKNLLVIGADIISFLKKREYNIEKLFMEIKDIKGIGLEQFYNTITFLWLAEIIEVHEFTLYLKNK